MPGRWGWARPGSTAGVRVGGGRCPGTPARCRRRNLPQMGAPGLQGNPLLGARTKAPGDLPLPLLFRLELCGARSGGCGGASGTPCPSPCLAPGATSAVDGRANPRPRARVDPPAPSSDEPRRSWSHHEAAHPQVRAAPGILALSFRTEARAGVGLWAGVISRAAIGARTAVSHICAGVCMVPDPTRPVGWGGGWAWLVPGAGRARGAGRGGAGLGKGLSMKAPGCPWPAGRAFQCLMPAAQSGRLAVWGWTGGQARLPPGPSAGHAWRLRGQWRGWARPPHAGARLPRRCPHPPHSLPLRLQ